VVFLIILYEKLVFFYIAVPWSFVLLGITSYKTKIFVSLYWQQKCRQFTFSDVSVMRDLMCPLLGLQRMLRRAASWIEEQKTPRCYPAVLRRRSFILQAVNTDYKYGSCKPQSTDYISQIGTMPAHAALSSYSLDMGGRLETIDSQSCDGVFQNGCENEGSLSPSIKQSVCNKNMEQSDTFRETHVHTTASSSILSSSEPLDPKEQKCYRFLQTCTQHNSKSEIIVTDPTYLNQELNLDAASVAVSIKQRLQMDVAEHWPMTDWENDSLRVNFYFPPYALLTSSVPALHQEVNHCEFSSDTDKAQIVNITQQLSLAEEVFEMEGNAEKYTQVRIVSWNGKSVKQCCCMLFCPLPSQHYTVLILT